MTEDILVKVYKECLARVDAWVESLGEPTTIYRTEDCELGIWRANRGDAMHR